MKKAFALLLALALIGGAVFAQDATIKGWGEGKWSYDLDTNLHGFTNAYDFTIDLSLFEGDKASTGEGTYGKASITDVILNISANDPVDSTPTFDDLDVTVSAAIVSGDLTTTLYSAPSLRQNNASHFSPWKDDDADYSDRGINFNPTVGGGLTFAYALGEMGSVNTKIASNLAGALNDFDDATAGNGYAFAFGTTLTPVDMVTLALGGAYDMQTKGAGATVKVSLAPADGITAFVATDLNLPDGADMQFDLAANLAATFGMTTIGTDVYFKDTALVQTLDAKLMVSDTGTVPGLTASLGLYVMDLLADPANSPMVLGFANSLAYKVSLSDTTYVTPYQKAAYDLTTEVGNALYLSVGVNAALIANTVFTVDYTSGAMLNKSFPGAGFVDSAKPDLGVFSVKARVSF